MKFLRLLCLSPLGIYFLCYRYDFHCIKVRERARANKIVFIWSCSSKILNIFTAQAQFYDFVSMAFRIEIIASFDVIFALTMEYFPRSNSRIRSGSTRDCFSTARAPFTGFNMKIMLINGRNSLRLELFLFPCHASIARNLFKRFSQGHQNWNRKARIADKFLGSSHKYEANLHPWDYVACWKLFARSFNEKPLSVRIGSTTLNLWWHRWMQF